ncbi:MAG TPA: hypothetical protein VGW98_07735 [Solirubrobacteraceae bacterium]|jgi:hypothetical protein|nr:hypothetical protein [Solirubrobacteraceae bacterium]
MCDRPVTGAAIGKAIVSARGLAGKPDDLDPQAAKLCEVSLAAVGVNEHARLDGVSSVVGVKAIGGRWIPATVAAEVKSVIDRAEDLEWLRGELQLRQDELDELSYSVARMRLRLRGR